VDALMDPNRALSGWELGQSGIWHIDSSFESNAVATSTRSCVAWHKQ